MIRGLKKELLQKLPDIFSKRQDKERAKEKEKVSDLYKSIGELKYENDWLKKNWKLWIWTKRIKIVY